MQSINKKLCCLGIFLFSAILLLMVAPAQTYAQASDAQEQACRDDRSKRLLGIFPKWYAYVSDWGPIQVQTQGTDGRVGVGPVGTETNQQDDQDFSFGCGFTNVNPDGSTLINALSTHAIQISLAVIDILIRLGGLVAFAFILIGGYKYMSSQGEPANIQAAMGTVLNAAIGLGIVIFATAIVSFIGNRLGG